MWVLLVQKKENDNSMKIVRYLGGLGNQMFQYAFYKALKQHFKRVKADLGGFESYGLHNGFELEKVFDIRLVRASPLEVRVLDPHHRQWPYRKLRRILNVRNAYFEERVPFSFDRSIFSDASSRLFWGYWQHCQYLSAIEDDLRKDFSFSPLQDAKSLGLVERLEGDGDYVAVHVRRGDYLKDPYLGGMVTLGYFQQALSLLNGLVANPRFVVFSDDVNWCRQHLNPPNALYVDWNRGKESFRDMQLMSRCQHAIISNSSFSWWGAWLNPNPKKIVVVPRVWCSPALATDTVGMHPKEWIKM